MKTAHAQRGMTMISLIMTFALIGFFALIAMRLLPLYLEDQSINSAMNGVAHDLPANTSLVEIRKSLAKRFDVNNVRIVKPTDFDLTKVGNAVTLSIDYEARAPFIANVSLVVEFSHEVTLGGAAAP